MEQCSTNKCQDRKAGLKCTDLRSCNDAEHDGNYADDVADGDEHELSDVDNIDDDHDDDDDEEEEEEDEGNE